MIPSEVSEIADLMVPEGWRDTVIEQDVLKAAWRVYNAGFRKSASPSGKPKPLGMVEAMGFDA